MVQKVLTEIYAGGWLRNQKCVLNSLFLAQSYPADSQSETVSEIVQLEH